MDANIPKSNLYIALVHYPVLNRKGDIIASAITNLDLHDLGRLACTYALPACYVVTPLKDQIALVNRLLKHWFEGIGRELHADREQALRRLCVVKSVEEAVSEIRRKWSAEPVVWATSAKSQENELAVRDAREMLKKSKKPYLLMFGTGWGLAPSILATSDAVLEKIEGIDGYNHLSVRSAAAILLDRLLCRDRAG